MFLAGDLGFVSLFCGLLGQERCCGGLGKRGNGRMLEFGFKTWVAVGALHFDGVNLFEPLVEGWGVEG